ncbi:MAG: ABC transporter permease [Candidatus Cryosericum sp.]|nr:ABC transporter permease [bacterium]
MLKFILQRVLSMILVVLIVATATFFMMRMLPSGPFAREKKLPAQIIQNLEARYHLDDPLWKQYIDYMGNLVRGDLGPSFKYTNRTVNSIINDGFPVSATLGVVAVLLSVAIGIPLGIWGALKQNGWQDNFVMFIALLGVSVPNFIMAVLLMLVFGLWLHVLPVAGWGSVTQVILPAFTLAGYPIAFIARLVRSSMIEVLRQEYITTARAKGISERLVILRHALRNILIPVVTVLGPLIASVFTGSFVVEKIFAIPGLGRYYVTSINDRDYTTILGVTIFYSALLVFMNFLVDLTYAWLDPRIRYVERKVS